jgi:hypothetical protein
MSFQRFPRVPPKSRLTWRIARLSLDASGKCWSATAVKDGRVATVCLPPLLDIRDEDIWLARIELAFEQSSHDPFAAEGFEHGPPNSE